MSDIATLLATKFIARRDVKAIQHADGSWSPHTQGGKRDDPRLKWTMSDLQAHLAKERTFGHYMIGPDDQCKLFAFDIDLEKNTPPRSGHPGFTGTYVNERDEVVEYDAREAWLDRQHPSREQTKISLMLTAYSLASVIAEELEIPTAVAYSGGKGVHVYGFTGLIPAADAREGAKIVLETVGDFEPTRGDNFFRTVDQSVRNHLRNLTIEVFPKQDSLEGKDLGNLMRLPLGRNLKNPKDPTFFIDLDKGLDKMTPMEPELALTGMWQPKASQLNG